MSVAVTNSGQFLFLYNKRKQISFPSATYDIHRDKTHEPWTLSCGEEEYAFSLPQILLDQWINEEASIAKIVDYKKRNLSSMIIYYKENNEPRIKMLSINFDQIVKLSEQIIVEESVHITKINKHGI